MSDAIKELGLTHAHRITDSVDAILNNSVEIVFHGDLTTMESFNLNMKAVRASLAAIRVR